MTLKIKSSSFYINIDNVELALNSLKETYPNTIELLTYDIPAFNLQLILFCLGYHIRVNENLSIFTISRCYKPKIENENPILTLTILSQYMTAESYIVAEEDGKEIRFEKNSKIVKIEEDTNTTVPSETSSPLSPELPSENSENIESIEINEPEVKIISKSTRKRNKRITAGPEDEEWVEK